MKPILFNTEMVRAIMAGHKTVTRRVVKPQPHTECDHGGQHEFIRDDFIDGISFTGFVCKKCGYGVCGPHFKFPVGTSWLRPPYRPGDILYVRETWKRNPYDYDKFWYRADGCYGPDMPWLPSIHMPKEAARLFLRVKAVRVERLQNLGIEEALDEGIIPTNRPGGCKCRFAFDGCMEEPCPNRTAYEIERHTYPFVQLWNRTIKPADRPIYSWGANPWVWVIEFRRITREEAEDA